MGTAASPNEHGLDAPIAIFHVEPVGRSWLGLCDRSIWGCNVSDVWKVYRCGIQGVFRENRGCAGKYLLKPEKICSLFG